MQILDLRCLEEGEGSPNQRAFLEEEVFLWPPSRQASFRQVGKSLWRKGFLKSGVWRVEERFEYA